METSTRSRSFFKDLKSRELNGFRVQKRPYIASDYSQIGAMAVEHNGDETPPLANSFCKTSQLCHVLAVSDEDGYVSLYNTRKKLSPFTSYLENAEKSRVSAWVAHNNAVFDVCWIKEDTHILTASGDQTIKLWDVQEKKCIGNLLGHTGSIKSLASHPTNNDLLVSGSRDGSFALWDLRCKSSSKSEESCISSTAVVKKAHISHHSKRVKRGKAASMSITSVLYLKDEVSIATAGAVDSVVKMWDTRNLKTQVTQTSPYPESTTKKEQRLHGISSISQDLNGTFLSASCMDNRIYLYNVLQLEKGPMQSFSGCQIGSFFVKSAISPDAANIVSGSSDGNAYIWQVNKPQMDPITLKGHGGEVTAVNWCMFDVGKIATSSDDFTVRIWNIQNSFCASSNTSTRSPSSVRKRVMALPNAECKKLLFDEKSKDQADTRPLQEMVTPESKEKKRSISDLMEVSLKTPESASNSPLSVLNPPSSLKRRTIRDYFISSS